MDSHFTKQNNERLRDSHVRFLVVEVPAVDEEGCPDPLLPEGVQDGAGALVRAVVERQVQDRGAFHSGKQGKYRLRD